MKLAVEPVKVHNNRHTNAKATQGFNVLVLSIWHLQQILQYYIVPKVP